MIKETKLYDVGDTKDSVNALLKKHHVRAEIVTVEKTNGFHRVGIIFEDDEDRSFFVLLGLQKDIDNMMLEYRQSMRLLSELMNDLVIRCKK